MLNYVAPHNVIKNNNSQKKSIDRNFFILSACWFCAKYYSSLFHKDHFDVPQDGSVTSSCLKIHSQLAADEKISHPFAKLSCYHDNYFIIISKMATLSCHNILNMCRMEAKLNLLVEKADRARQDHPTLSIPEGMRVAHFFNEVLCNHTRKSWAHSMVCQPTLQTNNKR